MKINNIKILEALVIQYQETEDPLIFEKILKRVDLLVFKIAHTLKANSFYLRSVDFADIYQTGIIGVRAAVLTAKMKTNKERIISRIAAYIKSNVRATYHRFNKEYTIGTAYTYEKQDNYLDNIDDLLTLKEILVILYKKKIITDVDLSLIKLRFTEQKIYKDIGNILGITTHAAWLRVKRVVEKIREYYILEGEIL